MHSSPFINGLHTQHARAAHNTALAGFFQKLNASLPCVCVCVHLIRLRSFSEAHRFVVVLCMEKRTIHLSPGKIERGRGPLEVSEKLERKSQGEALLSLASVVKKSIKFTRAVSQRHSGFTCSCLTLNYILVMEIRSNFG